MEFDGSSCHPPGVYASSRDCDVDFLLTHFLVSYFSSPFVPSIQSFGGKLFLFLSLLDISSHWCQMYSTAALGKHHKSEDGNEGRHFLVRWFYKYYYFFGYLCVGAEFTYILAYALLFTKEDEGSSTPSTTMMTMHAILTTILWLVIPGCFLKQLVNLMQLFSACYAVAQYDAETKKK